MSQPTGQLKVERDSEEPGVALVTIDRAEARNRLSRAMLEGLRQTCQQLADDEDLRVVVMCGRGRDFSVGVDLDDKELNSMVKADLGQRRRMVQTGPRLVAALQAMPQTTIVAMQGHCLGGAGCIALAADLRVAGADLKFGMPEVLRGMNMSWHSVPLMVAHFGPSRTKDLLLTGRFVEAEEAVSWGLANRLAGAGDAAVHETALLWARELASGVPPMAASMIKETVNAVANAHTAMVHMDADQFLLAQTSEDFREAMLAFLDKRSPEFKGR